MKLRCLLIDDEPIARDILASYAEKFEGIEIIGSFGSPLDAFTYLQSNKVDLIFLDIQMPELTGLQFLRSLAAPPKVILTTAYREFAVEAYELNAIDYLVKPITFERFAKAISRAAHTERPEIKTVPNEEEPYIFVKEERRLIKIYLREIIYLESQRDYVRIVTATREVTTRSTLSYFEELLPTEEFIRIHRSFILSIAKIESISESQVEAGGKKLSLGANYREAVMNRLRIR